MPRTQAQTPPAPAEFPHPLSPEYLTNLQALDHARQGQQALILVGYSNQAIQLSTAIAELDGFLRLNPDDIQAVPPEPPEGEAPAKPGLVRVLSCTAPEFICLDCSTGELFVDQYPDFKLFIHPSASLRAGAAVAERAKADSEAAERYAKSAKTTPNPPQAPPQTVRHEAGQ